ncbi:MAG: sodium:alanine symporter family protein [Succiniclasticum sp.]|jgi:AGCS family alanine or glycine:cation symporter|nr:sodium:alanine symporter family protein [Succiniclasticum sp.]MEE3478866.1 sodium:alanine symporter family protein [Succiniclasticum sp.]
MFTEILNQIDSYVWGLPLIVLLLGTGIMLTFRLRLLQVWKLPKALALIFTARNGGGGDVNSFKALCTALAATVGTGNIVGVATAVKAGGPGALFWMWIAAFFGMATKYAECLLAVRYRTTDANGEISGGPMHYIEAGLGPKFKPLAVMFAAFGVATACLGSGTFTQVNAISEITNLTFGIDPLYTSLFLAVLTGAIVWGGLKSIASVSSKVVPFMAVVYICITAGVLIAFRDQLPAAIALVLHDAFNPTAAAGGFLGATVAVAMRSGIARGIFSNEAGLGSAPIVAAAAKTKWAAEQGLVSMTGTFIDTIIICTMTGLCLVVTGVYTGPTNGAVMTAGALGMVFPNTAKYLLFVGLTLFAFSTILGWNYYGERCIEYLLGTKAIRPYRIVFTLIIASASFLKLESIWALADISNGLMAFPNLIALVLLSPVVVKETKMYFAHLDAVEERRRGIASVRAAENAGSGD